jgi:hypothetical protein
LRKKAVILLIVFFSTYAYSQEESLPQPGSISEQQLENLTGQQEGETEDDSYLQSLIQLQKNRINLNSAEENELHELNYFPICKFKACYVTEGCWETSLVFMNCRLCRYLI